MHACTYAWINKCVIPGIHVRIPLKSALVHAHTYTERERGPGESIVGASFKYYKSMNLKVHHNVVLYP